MTGGTGLVGSHVASLLRSEGFEVRALHRTGSDITFLEAIGCELVPGDLLDGELQFDELVVGCDALVHAAAVIYTDLPWPRVRELNVEGTAKLFRAASRAGIRRAVHISSVAVYGDREGPIDEGTSLDVPLRPSERYARSKRESERVVAETAPAADMKVAVLRPSAIYGEHDRLFTPKVARSLRLPFQPLPGGGRTTIPAIYAGNLAHAVLAGLRGPVPVGVRAYNVAEDHPLSQRELYAGLGAALDRRLRPVPIPGALATAAARLGECLGVKIPGAEELSLRRVVRLALRPNPYRSVRIREELGWSPPFSLEEALERTGRWLARAWDIDRSASSPRDPGAGSASSNRTESDGSPGEPARMAYHSGDGVGWSGSLTWSRHRSEPLQPRGSSGRG